MEAGTIPLSAASPMPALASPAPSSRIPSHAVSTASSQIPLPPLDSGLEQMQELHAGVVPAEMHARVVPVLRSGTSSYSKKKKKKGIIPAPGEVMTMQLHDKKHHASDH